MNDLRLAQKRWDAHLEFTTRAAVEAWHLGIVLLRVRATLPHTVWKQWVWKTAGIKLRHGVRFMRLAEAYRLGEITRLGSTAKALGLLPGGRRLIPPGWCGLCGWTHPDGADVDEAACRKQRLR